VWCGYLGAGGEIEAKAIYILIPGPRAEAQGNFFFIFSSIKNELKLGGFFQFQFPYSISKLPY
jgi:hypothetical protein